MPNPRSTASIADHPIHATLLPFEIAFFVGTFVCDLALIFSAPAISATVANTPNSSSFRYRHARASALTMVLSTRGRVDATVETPSGELSRYAATCAV